MSISVSHLDAEHIGQIGDTTIDKCLDSVLDVRNLLCDMAFLSHLFKHLYC